MYMRQPTRITMKYVNGAFDNETQRTKKVGEACPGSTFGMAPVEQMEKLTKDLYHHMRGPDRRYRSVSTIVSANVVRCICVSLHVQP